MIKTALLILLFSFCSSYGVLKNISMQCRKRSLEAARDSLFYLKNEIEFSNSDIFEAAKKTASRDRLGMFVYLQNRAFSPEENYRYAKEKSKKRLCLNLGDWEILDSFFETFGVLPKEMQTESLKKTLSETEKRLSEAEENSKKYSKLYASAGFLVGLFLVIILL